MNVVQSNAQSNAHVVGGCVALRWLRFGFRAVPKYTALSSACVLSQALQLQRPLQRTAGYGFDSVLADWWHCPCLLCGRTLMMLVCVLALNVRVCAFVCLIS
jgi:hypothetical protein